jgi:hypothetical protein
MLRGLRAKGVNDAVFAGYSRACDLHLTELQMVWRRMFGREELTAVEARQGFLGRPVLVVLIASTAMVCAVFGLLLLGY